MPKTLPRLDRKQASKLLSVSVRTIDRYIRSGKLPAFTERGRIWLNKEGILEFRQLSATPVKTNIDRTNSVAPRPSISPSPTVSAPDGTFYRDLYEEAKHALLEYQQKLEQANYRIGQLESHSVHPTTMKPIERREDSASYEFQRRELADREKEIFTLKEVVKRERASRIIFAVLTYLLLILQPIFWYFLR